MLTKPQLISLLAVAIAAWTAIGLWQGLALSTALLQPATFVITAVTAVLFIFDRWAWHWPIFRHWLVKRPYLQGTWDVEISSTWTDPQTGTRPAPITAYAVIRQRYSALTVRVFTTESTSVSTAWHIGHDEDGTCSITYAYRNQSKAAVRDRSPIHNGALLLGCVGTPLRELRGTYWTDRDTRGDIVFSKRRQELADSFEDARVTSPK